MTDGSLAVAETFYSLQGEGPTVGRPAVFVRLKGCNLTCGGLNTVKTKTPDNGATWRCDTIEVWLKGERMTYADIIAPWKTQIQNGAHIVITGGEPLLQDNDLVGFCKLLKKNYIEIETNATLIPSAALDRHITQYNVSPKLKNSGMPADRRIVHGALKWHCDNPKSVFKFVVSRPEDLEEIQSMVQVPPTRIFLMPAAQGRQELRANLPRVAQWAKERGYSLSNRLHLELWDRATGV